MKKSFLVLFLLINCFAYAQNIHRCATQEVFQQNVAQHPGYAVAVEHAFDYARAHNSARVYKNGEEWDTIFRIPVVVHVVYHTNEQNIEDSLITNQIEVLNQDYRRLNADTGNTRDIFKPVAADAGIEFFLATEDPDGNPTTGVTRTYTDTAFFSVLDFGSAQNGADYVKKTATGGIDAWDTDKYLNLWVCNLKDPNSFLGLVLGFAYPPDNAPNWPAEAFPVDSTLHGVVIHYEVFGRNNPRATGDLDLANKGRTTVHEVGHYLGLRHIWGDGPLSIIIPDCSVDDGIADTPNSGNNSQATGCDTTKNTCTEGNPDLPDMFENYMDYSREECQNVFTQGQVAIMRSTLATSRKELPYFPPATGMTNVKNTLAMQLYPNPADGLLHLAFSEGESVLLIAVNDLVGKTWITMTPEKTNKLTLDLHMLPAGAYNVTAFTKNGSAMKKLMVY